MAYKITNKERIANHDAIKAERDTLSLALYDLVNGKFSEPVKVKETDYDPHGEGYYQVRVSMRGMPLYLVTSHSSGSHAKCGRVDIYTEDQIERFCSGLNHISRWQAIRSAVNELKHRHYPKAAA